jgi:hypothetical protein
VHPAVAALPFEEKGLLLGAVLARVAPEAVAARFGDLTGGRCRAAMEALSAEKRADRAAALAALIALVRAPVPAGIERIHRGWLAERLAPESSAIIRAVAAGLPVEVGRVAEEIRRSRGEGSEPRSPPIAAAGLAELRRAVFAGLVPMTGPAVPPASPVQALLALSCDALEEAIERRGAETLGASLQGAPAAVVARAAAGLGGQLARALLDAAARPADVEARERARCLVAVTAAQSPAVADRAWDLGARAFGAALAREGDAALQAVAQRLPPARGRRWLACARDPLG